MLRISHFKPVSSEEYDWAVAEAEAIECRVGREDGSMVHTNLVQLWATPYRHLRYSYKHSEKEFPLMTVLVAGEQPCPR